MKKIASLTLMALMGLSLVAPAFAQAPGPKGGAQAGPGGRQGGGNRMARMGQMEKDIFAKLNLKADQKKKLEAIDAKYKAKFAEEMKKMGGPGGGMGRPGPGGPGGGRTGGPGGPGGGPGGPGGAMGGMREMMQARRKEQMGVLDKVQQKKYTEMMEAERAKWRANRPGGGPGGPGGVPGGKKGGGKGI